MLNVRKGSKRGMMRWLEKICTFIEDCILPAFGNYERREMGKWGNGEMEKW
jgi:hypothetical protein